MNPIYNKLETAFEKLVAYATKAYGNSLTFILAVVMVLFYLFSGPDSGPDPHF